MHTGRKKKKPKVKFIHFLHNKKLNYQIPQQQNDCFVVFFSQLKNFNHYFFTLNQNMIFYIHIY